MPFPFSFDTGALASVVKIEPLPPAAPPTIAEPSAVQRARSMASAAERVEPNNLASAIPSAPGVPMVGGMGGSSGAPVSVILRPCRVHVQVGQDDVRTLVVDGYLECEADANINYTQKNHPIWKEIVFTLTYDSVTGNIMVEAGEGPYSLGFHIDNFKEASVHDGDKRRKGTVKAKATDDDKVLSFGAEGIEERHYDTENDCAEFVFIGHVIALTDVVSS